MPLKTRKTMSKRFTVKRSKKRVTVEKRTDGQDHFNSRESGNTKRNKRSDKTVGRCFKRTILNSIPNF